MVFKTDHFSSPCLRSTLHGTDSAKGGQQRKKNKRHFNHLSSKFTFYLSTLQRARGVCVILSQHMKQFTGSCREPTTLNCQKHAIQNENITELKFQHQQPIGRAVKRFVNFLVVS